MPDLHRLRVLRTVVATGSVRAAAGALGFTPSAVSQQLTVLQRETGLVLLRRRGRGLEPTVAGRTLAAAAEPLLAELANVQTLVADLRAGRSATLSLAYFTSAGVGWVPEVVSVLVREFPDTRLDLRLSELRSTRSDMEMFIAMDGTDPSSRGSDVARDSRAIHHLRDDPYLAVVPRTHPLAGRDEIALVELATERWIDNDVTRGSCRDVILQACGRAGFSPSFTLEAPDHTSAMALVAVGLGVTTVPRLALERVPAGAVAIPIAAPTPLRRISLSVRAAVEQHPLVQRTVELLRDGVPLKS